MAISGLDKNALTAAYLEKMKGDARRRSETEGQAYQDQRAQTMRWGNDAMQGATTGMTFGGPWGALVGGIIGGAKGIYRAAKAREGEGEDLGTAFGTTLLDFDNSLPSLDTAAPMASAVGQYRNRQAYNAQNQKLIDSINEYTKAMWAKQVQVIPDDKEPTIYPGVESYEWNRRNLV